MAYCYDGKTYETIKEMAEEYGIDRQRIYSFRRRGWSLEDAMQMCINDVRGRGRLFEYNGKLYRSPKALAEEYGLPWNSLAHYIQRCKTVEEAVDFFDNLPKIRNKIQTLYDVGLGYIKLGQSATTLSGGEAQRVKLASELQKKSTGKTVYILDEPTTGLHSHDVARLIDVLQRIVDQGDTIIVIEHNLDVIKVADHIIDLGPEGGAGGGTIVVTGTPEKVAKCEKSYTGQFLKSML